MATGKRGVTPALALRVARFAGVGMDELLAGQWLSARVCPHCGHPPDDFVDEEPWSSDRAGRHLVGVGVGTARAARHCATPVIVVGFRDASGVG